MKSKFSKVLALLLCGGLVAGGIGAAAYGWSDGRGQQPPAGPAPAPASPSEKEAVPVKDETVYVLAGADGRVQKLIVSDWIKNQTGAASLSDRSELTQAETVKGDATYTMDGDSLRVWDTQGQDVYYQGQVEKELPVTLSVSYKLDGTAVSPEELAGKSGQVSIRFDYENLTAQEVEIDGERKTMKVPYAMLTGLLLDNDRFSNVEVTNGKLINDGDRTAVIGLAFPGLQGNLELDRDKFELPDYVEITADVRDFSMTNTVTVATSEIFTHLEEDQLDFGDELTDSLNKLTDAMDQLIDGSSSLYDGLCTLLEKSEELTAGIDQLASGAQSLKQGAAGLSQGASQLANGAKTLADGLQQLSSQNDALNGGAKQVFDSLLAMAGQQLTEAGLEVPPLTAENYGQVFASITETMGKQAEAAKAQAAQLPAEQAKAVQAQLAEMEQKGAALSALKTQLDSYNAFYTGLTQYTGGVASAAQGAGGLVDGSQQLQAGAAQLQQGMDQLYDGILTMKEGAPALLEGVTQLRDGSMELSDGLKEFQEEGVQKLIDAADGDLGGLFTRIQATVDAAKSYQTFSGLSEDMEGQVKFVYRTDAIGE